jgi:hypothetical protein
MRFKSEQHRSVPAVSDPGFRDSLSVAGFSDDEIGAISRWLAGQRDQIRELGVGAFVSILEERGVSADPARRTPNRWTGPLMASSGAATADLGPLAPDAGWSDEPFGGQDGGASTSQGIDSTNAVWRSRASRGPQPPDLQLTGAFLERLLDNPAVAIRLRQTYRARTAQSVTERQGGVPYKETVKQTWDTSS